MRIEKRQLGEFIIFSMYDENYREIESLFFNSKKNKKIFRMGIAFEKVMSFEGFDFEDVEHEFGKKCSPILEITDSEHIEIEKLLFEII